MMNMCCYGFFLCIFYESNEAINSGGDSLPAFLVVYKRQMENMTIQYFKSILQ